MKTDSLASPVVVGTGLVALDLVIVQGETGPARAWAGGTCGNVLTILSNLGWDAFPIARLGNDHASELVAADLSRWGVRLDFVKTAPAAFAPIIVQLIKNKGGSPTHRFLWSCPHCGKHLPSYRPVTVDAMEGVLVELAHPQVCFLDRVSRAAINLAEWAVQKGALVVFEPSGKCDSKLFSQALKLAHVLKYSSERYGELDAVKDSSSTVLLEIQTAGVDGLRFKNRLPLARSRDWIHLPAIRATRLVDSCGAGDWTTAGLIAKVCCQGLAGLLDLDFQLLLESLVYGQTLSAWNCGFEGARGGMYSGQLPPNEISRTRSSSAEQTSLLHPPSKTRSGTVHCPACPIDKRELAMTH